MKIRFTFRFYPSDRQKIRLAKEFGCARHAYNFALRLRTDSYKDGKPVNYCASSAAWTKHRNDPKFSFLKDSSSVVQQQSIRQLQTAFNNFFSKHSRYPKFRSKHGKQSATYTGDGFKWDSDNKNLRIAKIGRLNVYWSRGFTSQPSSVTITKDCAGRYFVGICLDEPARAALPKTGKHVGIDLGISRLATLSNGERIANPRHTARFAGQLLRLQRVLSRRKKGSNRWKRQKLRVARLNARIADTRKDCMNKLTTDLIHRFDVLAIEDLNVSGLIKNHKLAKSIGCASFWMFRRMLAYKCEWYGKELRVADRFFPSSKRCSTCGHIHEKMPLYVREFNCAECGTTHDRDENAAKNILVAGQATTGRGGTVRPVKASALKGKSRRSVNQPALRNADV